MRLNGAQAVYTAEWLLEGMGGFSDRAREEQGRFYDAEFIEGPLARLALGY